MFTSLIARIRMWSPVRWISRWRRNLLNFWFTWEKENFVFFAIFGLAIVLIGSMVYVVYADHLRLRWQQQRQADLMCLARNVYHEARGEPTAGQHAVAEVTLNRVASRQFPATVCEVVYEKRFDVKRNRLVGAFSWTEFDWVSKPKGIAWERAVRSAEAVYDKQQDPTVKGALFYHADSIEPRWAKEKNQVAKIGSHIFYE
jgi:spore germination cell wall hydrolase CwlJ-like protein